MKKFCIGIVTLLCLAACSEKVEKIDRHALVERNNPVVKEFEELSSLSVGNGEFAFTVDATGLQTFPDLYSAGVPLGTQSQWGWHSFANPEKFRHDETLKSYNFRGLEEPYAVQFNESGRKQKAADWYRVNPHRLHLGNMGLELTHANGTKAKSEELKNVNQELKLWDGVINSSFEMDGVPVQVQTACHPQRDMVAAHIRSSLVADGKLGVNFRFAYPTGKHADDACDWSVPEKHTTKIVKQSESSFVFQRTLDSTVYYVLVQWTGGKALVKEVAKHYFVLSPSAEDFYVTCEFMPVGCHPELVENHVIARTRNEDEAISKQLEIASRFVPHGRNDVGGGCEGEATLAASSAWWQSFWQRGGAVDFSACKAKEAAELERRVVLSQYLMAIQCAGSQPPQESGLTYNTWYGKFHLEMHWWHAVHFALWNRIDLLERSIDWYAAAYPVAKSIAERQKFKGARWMKMTDQSGTEAPSKVGSFLIWQQPHFIYMAELIYRSNPSKEVLEKYAFLIAETAEFMASFATYDELHGRYILKGAIPAQETLNAATTVNSPFELSYWHYAMGVAQAWRERMGLKRKPQWDELIDKLSPLAYNEDGLYLAAESATDTYKDIRFTSDHMAVLGALGILPQCKLVRPDYMKNTLNWVWKNWNWGKTWGWDYPMTAMNAARLGDPEKAVGALLMDKRTNTYLVSGHNYQDSRLRVYLPGNGGLLTAVAMMCAGWDGCETKIPGFPKDGSWNVKWEGLAVMP